MTSDTQKQAPKGSKLGVHAGAKAQRRAAGNWARYEYILSRGHRDWVLQAQKCDRFYIGAGLQWDYQTRAKMEAEDRRCPEQNEILGMVNTAIGYQIANRMDIAIRPRGRGADEETAATLQKVIKQVADNTKLHWVETEVFGDGMIKGRGYFDIRMSFDSNAMGEIAITSLDGEDVLPDPDAREYDPDTWADVTINRYYTLDQIEQQFGKNARMAVESFGNPDIRTTDQDATYQDRSRFGDQDAGNFSYYSELGHEFGCIDLYQVIDRQYRTFELVQCAVYPNGDIRQVPDATPEQLASYQQDHGAIITKRMQRRVKWLVTTSTCVLFDDYSPYPWFTVVPFFPYFRRGRTIGMVHNAISVQESVNKGIAAIGHILSSMANSGWAVEEESLVDTTIDEFKEIGAKTGLVIQYKKGSTPPKRLDGPVVPTGLFEYVTMQVQALKNSVGGMDESLTASGPVGDQSGVAYQARQYAAQQKLAIPLDNLGRTRHMVSQRVVDLIQMFMTAPQVIRITELDTFGTETSSELAINQPLDREDGTVFWLNDMTIGEYDVVISEQPMQITFDNSQFEQMRTLIKEMGFAIPPEFVIRYTNLAEKAELAKAMADASATKPDPLTEAKVKLILAQVEKTVEETVNKRIEAVYGSTQAGAQIGTMPQVAALADEILQSSGFRDQNAAPIIPQGVPGAVGAGLAAAAPERPVVAPTNQAIDPTDPSTNPTTPENPGMGITAGIESPGLEPA